MLPSLNVTAGGMFLPEVVSWHYLFHPIVWIAHWRILVYNLKL